MATKTYISIPDIFDNFTVLVEEIDMSFDPRVAMQVVVQAKGARKQK